MAAENALVYNAPHMTTSERSIHDEIAGENPPRNGDEATRELAASELRYRRLFESAKDGQTREVEFVSNIYLAGGKRVIQCNIRDITERKRIETYLELKQDILHVLNEPGDTKDRLPHVIALLKAKAEFDAVAIRLRDGDAFPYFAQNGFSADFLQKENSLNAPAKPNDVNGGANGGANGHFHMDGI